MTAPRNQVAPFVARWERRARELVGTVLEDQQIEPLVAKLYVGAGAGALRCEMVDSPGAGAGLIASGALGTPRLCNDGWMPPAVSEELVGDGRLAFDATLTIWTALVREQSSIYALAEDRMRWSVGLRFGVLDDWYPVYDWLGWAHPALVTERQRTLLSAGWGLGWYWTFEDRVLVCQPPVELVRSSHESRVMFRDGWAARAAAN